MDYLAEMAAEGEPIDEMIRACNIVDTGQVRLLLATHADGVRLPTEVDKLRAALTKVSAIRDSIVGRQGFNWSEHAYPLVAALGEVGFKGAGYEIAKKNLGTLIEQIEAAEADVARLTAERDEANCTVELTLRERDEARAKARAVTATRDDVWFWQGNGDDPESLVCPIVMSADTLRELLAAVALVEAWRPVVREAIAQYDVDFRSDATTDEADAAGLALDVALAALTPEQREAAK